MFFYDFSYKFNHIHTHFKLYRNCQIRKILESRGSTVFVVEIRSLILAQDLFLLSIWFGIPSAVPETTLKVRRGEDPGGSGIGGLDCSGGREVPSWGAAPS